MPNVTLQVSIEGTYLDVDQAGNGNQVAHGQQVTITWHLKIPEGSEGSFDNPGGLIWISPLPLPADVFGPPSFDGKKMSITDNNSDPNGINSAGQWIYQLHATIDGSPYQTVATTLPTAVTTNPTIKNDPE